MKNQTQKSAILSENHPPAFAVEFITDKKQLCEQTSMKVKHSLPFPFLVLIKKVKKDGGYNSCYFLSLAGRMLTTGWHQKVCLAMNAFGQQHRGFLNKTCSEVKLGQIIKQL